MRMRLWTAVAALLLAASSSTLVPAQSNPRYGGDNEIGVWAGFSPVSGAMVAGAPDRKFFISALRYSRVLNESRNVGLRYTIDLIPAAVVFQPKNGYNALSGGHREAIYAAGIAPVGLQLNFRRQKALQPFGVISGGLLYFTRNVPVPGSSNFNFTFDFGAGAQYFYRPRHAFTAGYMFYHLSNANIATHNPGIDNNVFYGGLSWYW